LSLPELGPNNYMEKAPARDYLGMKIETVARRVA